MPNKTPPKPANNGCFTEKELAQLKKDGHTVTLENGIYYVTTQNGSMFTFKV